MNIHSLVRDGILRIASLPPANWGGIDDDRPFTLPLIAEDYRAKTAAMWNLAYNTLGMPDRNTMMVADPSKVALIVQAFRSAPLYVGGGAGIGFKEVIIPHLDTITPLAKAMGAVNIVKKERDGRLVGENTDGEGYATSLAQVLAEKGKSIQGAHILMLGAGGSGRAIAFALVDKGATLTILNRTEKKALELAAHLNAHFSLDTTIGGGRNIIGEILPSQDAVVSVVDDAISPLDGYSTLGAMELPITPESLVKNKETAERLLKKARPSLIVSDIRIREEQTPMLMQAQKLGFRTLNGIPMVVNQGVAAFCWVYQEMLEQKGIETNEIASIMWGAIEIR